MADKKKSVTRVLRESELLGQHANQLAKCIQTMTGASDDAAHTLTRLLVNLAEEIKRQAIEP